MKQERDYFEEGKQQKAQLKASREKTLKKLQATMQQKEMTEKEQAIVQSQLDHVYRNEFIVHTDGILGNHI